jgi:hypothetical protein
VDEGESGEDLDSGGGRSGEGGLGDDRGGYR